MRGNDYWSDPSDVSLDVIYEFMGASRIIISNYVIVCTNQEDIKHEELGKSTPTEVQSLVGLNRANCWGGGSILMYTHYPKRPKYTYTLYINIH